MYAAIKIAMCDLIAASEFAIRQFFRNQANERDINQANTLTPEYTYVNKQHYN